MNKTVMTISRLLSQYCYSGWWESTELHDGNKDWNVVFAWTFISLFFESLISSILLVYYLKSSNSDDIVPKKFVWEVLFTINGTKWNEIFTLLIYFQRTIMSRAAQKLKFSVQDFCSKFEQICSFQRIFPF